MHVSRAVGLLKFINKDSGPVLSISSTPYPGFFHRHLWHSTAELHPKLFSSNAKFAVMQYCGGGWSTDKEESQRKAVTEAVERWAFFDYSHKSPEQAGINLDASSNGFAAIPSEIGQPTVAVNAYCEAAERWILNRIWDAGDIPVSSRVLHNKSIVKMLTPLSRQISCFSSSISTGRAMDGIPAELSFALCLLKTEAGGAIAGAACSITLEQAIERAALEAYLHAVSFSRMVKAGLTSFENIIERRLFHFAKLDQGHMTVMSKLRLTDAPLSIKPPAIIFSKTLPGAWDPEIIVHRVLLADSRPILNGGVDRFFI